MVMAFPPQYGVGNAGDPDQGGSGFRPRNISSFTIVGSERYQILDRKQQWFDATQDRWKPYNWDGQRVQPGLPTAQPNLAQAGVPFFVPMSWRRASNPYRLARVITSAFTRMLFGHGRFPQIKALGDENTEGWCKAVVKETRLASKMIQARNLGGSMGTVALSWCFKKGRPRIAVHNAKHLFVDEWADRDELIPWAVIEMYRYPVDEWTREKGYQRNWYWYRRDWTSTHEVVYKPILFEDRKEPDWDSAVDYKKSVQHNLGFCPVIWIQNLPSDEIDGECDYETLFENFDEINQVFSVNSRGTKLNMDPTLVLSGKSMEPAFVQRFGVQKGSDNALAVGEGGDARYLEIGGQAAAAGLELFREMRRSALEVAECILPDPNEIAAQGVSRVALDLIYAPMTTKSGVHREQYGEGLKRLFEQMLSYARSQPPGAIILPPKVISPEEQRSEWEKEQAEKKAAEEAAEAEEAIRAAEEAEAIAAEQPPDPAMNGFPQPQQQPAVPKKPKMPPPLPPEFEPKLAEHDPGLAEHVDPEFGPFFPLTGADQQQVVTALSTATGGKAILDKQSASEIAARAFSVDPTEVWDRLNVDRRNEVADTGGMFGDKTGDAGGAPKGPGGLPPGAQPRKPFGGKPFGGKPFGGKPFGNAGKGEPPKE